MRVDVSPDMGMYKLLTRQGYEASFALAEFVDNAIDAHLKHQSRSSKDVQQLDIKLKFYSESYADPALRNVIVIEDNGPGISHQRLQEAFKPAKVSGSAGLSEFGIGMKAAAVWFADVWTLRTVPVSGNRLYETQFNLMELLAKGKSTINVEESARTGAAPGTTISLLKLRRAITKELYANICQDLVEIYQRFTEGTQARVYLSAEFDETISDLNFTLPDDRQTLFAERYETLAGKTYLVGPKREWTQPISFVFEGKRVDGFLSLLAVGSYKDNPGIILFRNNRVITGTSRHPNIPVDLVGTSNKYGRQRIYGELNMDGLPVTYTKDRFEIDTAAFVECVRQAPGVAELIKQSDRYRSNLKDGAWEKVSEQAFQKKTTKPAASKKPAKKASATGASGGGSAGASGTAASTGTAKPAPPAPPPDLASVLITLQSNTSSLALKNVLAETIFQYRWGRAIATALCLRIVLEAGILEKIRKDYPTTYPAVSDKAIAGLITYMQGNMTTFLNAQRDYKVVKCIQSNAVKGQGDVMMLNNVSHGHYNPVMQEVDKFISNLEPLLLWAYS
ncbi:MAG: ATP-binding protein [Betaproteobacteria bacterium]|nr:ATP-binding protein [Betaproteobacteria bacterium]